MLLTPPRCSYTSEMVERGGYTSLDLLDGDCVVRPEGLGGRFPRPPGSPGPQVPISLCLFHPAGELGHLLTAVLCCLLEPRSLSSSEHVSP